MKKSILFITIAVVVMALLFGVLSFFVFQPTVPYESSKNTQVETVLPVQDSSTEKTTSTTTTTQNETVSELPSKISQSILAQHDSQQDCWVGYNGKAYDITSFLPKHEGGVSAISRNCGTSDQFQQAFQKQHGTSKASLFIKVAIYKGDLE